MALHLLQQCQIYDAGKWSINSEAHRMESQPVRSYQKAQHFQQPLGNISRQCDEQSSFYLSTHPYWMILLEKRVALLL